MVPTLDYVSGPDQVLVVERHPKGGGETMRLTVGVHAVAGRRVGWILWTVAADLLLVVATICAVTYVYILAVVGEIVHGPAFHFIALIAGLATVGCFALRGDRRRVISRVLRFTPHMVDAAKADWHPAADAESDFAPDDPAGWHIPAAAVQRIEVVPPARPGDSADYALRVVGTNGTAFLQVPTPEPTLQTLAAEARRVVGLEQQATDNLSD